MVELNNTIDQIDITDICKILYPAAANYTFFSEAHGTFSNINHTLGYKASLNKYKEIEITFWILSEHNGIKLELNSKQNYRKYSKT
jgi:hypothetical protein